MVVMARANVIRITTVLVNISWYFLMVGLTVITGFALYGVAMPARMSWVLSNTTIELRELGLSLDVPLHTVAPGAIRPLFGLVFGLGLAAMLLMFAVVSQLRGILSTTASGTPFVSENAGRVRSIGFAVLGWAVLKTLAEAVMGTFLATHLTWPGVHLNVKVDLSAETVVFGLLILVLAEVFRYGIALQEEHDLTV